MTAAGFSPETVLARKSGLPQTAVDDDLVILSVATQKYVGLDAIGRALWELLAQPRRVDDLCRAMIDRYAGVPDEIAADVVGFLGELEREGLIEVAAP